MHASALRRKIDRPAMPSLIETVRGVGYRLPMPATCFHRKSPLVWTGRGLPACSAADGCPAYGALHVTATVFAAAAFATGGAVALTF